MISLRLIDKDDLVAMGNDVRKLYNKIKQNSFLFSRQYFFIQDVSDGSGYGLPMEDIGDGDGKSKIDDVQSEPTLSSDK